MKITPPADDYGLQKLRQANTHSEVKETGKVDAYPRIASSEERHESQRPMQGESRRQQRRERERRLVKTNSLINTRDSHERRLEQRRETEEETGEADSPSTSHGVDDFA